MGPAVSRKRGSAGTTAGMFISSAAAYRVIDLNKGVLSVMSILVLRSRALTGTLSLLLIIVLLGVFVVVHPVSATWPSTSQLLRNARFEEGLAHWVPSGAVQHVSSPVRSGAGAARLSGGSASLTQWNIVIPKGASSVIPRFAYRFTDATGSLRMTIIDATSNAELYASNTVSVWSDEVNIWKYYDEQLRAEDIARVTHGKTVIVRLASVSATVFVDDVTLTSDGMTPPEDGEAPQPVAYLPLILHGETATHPGSPYTRVDAMPMDGTITDIEFRGGLGFMTGSQFTAGRLWGWDGKGWMLLPGSTNLRDLNAVTILPSGEAWAVGGYCSIVHRTGTSWKLDAVPSNCAVELADIWANSASDGWAISSYRELLRWNGSRWSAAGELPGEDGNVSRALAFFNTDLGFIVGQAWATDARIWTYQQGTWRSQTYPGLRSFSGIALRGTDGWIVGERGVTLRWVNGSWVQQPSHVTTDFQNVHIAPDGQVFATAEGTLLDLSDKVYQRVGDRWVELPAPPDNTRLKPGPLATGPDGSLWVGGVNSLLRYHE